MSIKSQEAFTIELRSMIERFCKEWDINRVEVVGVLSWTATAIVAEALKETDEGETGKEPGDG